MIEHEGITFTSPDGLAKAWGEYFKTRKDPVCKSYVGDNKELSELYLKTAKENGAKRGRFYADGSVGVYFGGLNETS